MPELDVALVAPNVVRADGQGQAMLELARALAARGHRVTVYAHRLDAHAGPRVSHRRIPDVPGPRLVADLVFFALATLALRRSSHDVTCVMGPCAAPPAPFVYYAQFSHAGWRRTWADGSRPAAYHRAHGRLGPGWSGGSRREPTGRSPARRRWPTSWGHRPAR
jgi:hypothetical protein